ncbi:kinase-like domain, phloem protein 2-like protein [Tanacetum coccineum]
MEVVIKELDKAIQFQKSNKDNLYISLENIQVATENFSNDKCIKEILEAIKVLVEFKQKNIVALVGYNDEMGERIICYENTLNGRLSKCVQDASLSWMQRMKICVDIATELGFLHKGYMVYSDIKSGSILLNKWNAKIYDMELASNAWNTKQWKHSGDDYGSLGFMNPKRENYVIVESDWYLLCMILLEMFYGRFAKDLEPWGFCKNTLVRCASIEYFIDHVAFDGIKEQINAKSCNKFFKVAFQCGKDIESPWRVSKSLDKALEAQEDHEIWEPKLPIDYQGILDSSKIYVRKYSKKRLYELLCKGVLIKIGDAWVSLGNNRRINEMISARKFVFKNSWLCKWRSTPESRVYLVLKFCGQRKYLRKPSYVNRTYKMGKETLHAYCATWRDEEWMIIEVCRFLNHKKDTNFEVPLESFLQYCCERNGIYIEGIEFRAIHDVNNEESLKIEEVQQVLESSTDMVQVQQLPTDSEDEENSRTREDDAGALDRNVNLVEYLEF